MVASGSSTLICFVMITMESQNSKYKQFNNISAHGIGKMFFTSSDTRTSNLFTLQNKLKDGFNTAFNYMQYSSIRYLANDQIADMFKTSILVAF